MDKDLLVAILFALVLLIGSCVLVGFVVGTIYLIIEGIVRGLVRLVVRDNESTPYGHHVEISDNVAADIIVDHMKGRHS